MNDITELRRHLFDALRGLKNGSMKIEDARAINDTAQVIINSVKVEVDHMKVAGGCSSFISSRIEQPIDPDHPQITQTQGGVKTITQLPGATVTQHKMRG